MYACTNYVILFCEYFTLEFYKKKQYVDECTITYVLCIIVFIYTYTCAYVTLHCDT